LVYSLIRLLIQDLFLAVAKVSHPVAAGVDRDVRSIQWWLVVATGPEEDEDQRRAGDGQRKERTRRVRVQFISFLFDAFP
jgi:hypothetical protein